MEEYRFVDTDYCGHEERDIYGQEYSQLMETCFQYCAFVSFRLHPALQVDKRLTRYRIPVFESVCKLYYGLGEMAVHIREGLIPFKIECFELMGAVKEYLLIASQSLWGWGSGYGCDNPEDLAFYRPDGTVFMYTSTHDGICVLTPKENEHVDFIVSRQHWEKVIHGN